MKMIVSRDLNIQVNMMADRNKCCAMMESAIGGAWVGLPDLENGH